MAMTYAPTITTRGAALRHELDQISVPAEVRQLARDAAHQVATYLKLDPVPRVRWLPATALDIRGIVFSGHADEVWVTLQAEPADVVETTAHEVTHAHQVSTDGPRPSAAEMRRREEAADLAGQKARRRFLNGRLPLVGDLLDAPTPAPRPSSYDLPKDRASVRRGPPIARGRTPFPKYRPKPGASRRPPVTAPPPATRADVVPVGCDSRAPQGPAAAQLSREEEQQRRRRLWQQKYGPIHEAERQAVLDRAAQRSTGRHGPPPYPTKVLI